MKQYIKYLLLANLAIIGAMSVQAQSAAKKPLGSRVNMKPTTISPALKAAMQRSKTQNYAQQVSVMAADSKKSAALASQSSSASNTTPANNSVKQVNLTETQSSDFKSKLTNKQ